MLSRLCILGLLFASAGLSLTSHAANPQFYNFPNTKFKSVSSAARQSTGCPTGVGGTAVSPEHQATGQALCDAHADESGIKFLEWYASPTYDTWSSCGDNFLCKQTGGNMQVVNGCDAGGKWTNIVICEYKPFDCGDRWTYTIQRFPDVNDWQLNWTKTHDFNQYANVNGTRFVCEPQACKTNICRGTNPDKVDECFLTNTGEYKRLNGNTCPFCPTGQLPVLDASNAQGFRCSAPAKSVVPQTVAPDQVAQLTCAGLTNVVVIPGTSAPIHASQYQIVVKNAGNTIFTSGWKQLSTINSMRVGNEWYYLQSLAQGDYDVTCSIRYPGTSTVYTSINSFSVSSTAGTRCEDLSVDPEEVSVGGTTQANCTVSNAAGGLRSVTTTLESDKAKCYSDFFSYGKMHSPALNINNTLCASGWNQKIGSTSTTYPENSQINTYNVLKGFIQNGTYSNICYAYATGSYVGFTAAEKTNMPYVGVTSSACGYENTTPIYVGESYCSSLTTPSVVYEDREFNVVCQLQSGSSTPTAYDLLVDDAIVATGSVPADASTLSIPVTLTAGNHKVECLIRGPQNTTYISPSCRKTVIPDVLPAGSCQPGDSILNATLCPGDSTGVGSDVPAKVVSQCTTSRKCEYQCVGGFAPINGQCQRAASYGTVTVPSHLRPGEDYPLVMCQGQPGDKFFKYQIVRNGDVTDLVCPTGSTGTYPSCVCTGSNTYNPTLNICETTGCSEGEYYCESEGVCKPAGDTCTTVTCNNNNICEAGESCNCADCNNQADHCGLSTTGEQLYCTADTYTAPTVTVPATCEDIRYPTVNGNYIAGTAAAAEQYCTDRGFGSGTLVTSGNIGSITNIATQVNCCGNVALSCQRFTNPVIGGGRVHVGAASTTQYCIEQGYSEPMLSAWNIISGTLAVWNGTSWYGNNDGGAALEVDCCTLTPAGSPAPSPTPSPAVPQVGACCPAGKAWNSDLNTCSDNCFTDKFPYCLPATLGGSTTTTSTTCDKIVAYTYPGVANTYVYLAPYPGRDVDYLGNKLVIYDPVRILRNTANAANVISSDPQAAWDAATVIPTGSVRDTRSQFIESDLAYTDIPNLFSTGGVVFVGRHLLRDQIGGTQRGNGTTWVPGIAYDNTGTIYVSLSDSNSGVTYRAGQTLGIYDVDCSDTTPTTPPSTCQSFMHPIKNDGYVKDDAPSITQYCIERGFTSGTLVSSSSSGATKSIWSGSAWTTNGSGGSYAKEITCCGGSEIGLDCQNYNGNVQVSGGYLSIQPVSTTQFCVEQGYTQPYMVSQYTQPGSCRLWNGTSWYEDISCVAVSDINCCNVTP